MKYNLRTIISVIFIAVILGYALLQDGLSNKEHLIHFPTIEELSSAQIDIGGPPARNKGPISMDFNDNMQKITIAKILYWLSHAEYVGPAHQFISDGGGPNEFVMKTKDGESIGIEDAFDTVSITISNGWMATSVSVADDITVSYDNKILRFKSPDLKLWIENDMNKIIEDRMKQPQKQ